MQPLTPEQKLLKTRKKQAGVDAKSNVEEISVGKDEGEVLGSRFSAKVIEAREADIHGMVLATSLFAAVAECVNTIVTPALSFRGMDATGTFTNVSGAWLCGLAFSLASFGPRSCAISEAFRGGFVGAYTSFCHTIEHAVALHCGRASDSAAHMYLASALLGGPLFFEVGRRMGCRIFPPMEHIQKEEEVLATIRHALVAIIVLAVAFQGQHAGLAAATELTVGVCMSMCAIYAGDTITIFAIHCIQNINKSAESKVNWGTIFANGMAVATVVLCEYSQSMTRWTLGLLPPIASWFLVVFIDKFRTSFCGAVSAYGGFSEDVADMLVQRNLDGFAGNIGMNALIVILAFALLSHSECPFG